MSMRIRAFLALSVLATLTAAWGAGAFFASNLAVPDGRRPQGFVFDTSDESFWTVQKGWLNTGNGHDLITPDGYSYAVIDSPGSDSWTDYEISCRFYMEQPRGQVILAGRWVDRRNHYEAIVEVGPGGRFLKLVKQFKGKTRELKVEPINLDDLGVTTLENGSAASALDLSLSFVGSEITARLGGKVQVVAQDFDILTGTAALGERYTEASFLDIAVSSPSKAAGSAPQTIAGSVAPGVPGRLYTVRLNEYNNIADARSLASQLRLLSYVPTVGHHGEWYSVDIGRFSSLEEANKMLLEMISQQFLFAKVVVSKATAEETAATPAATPVPAGQQEVLDSIPPELRRSVNWQEMTPSEQRKVIEAIRAQEAMRSKTQSVSEIMDLKQKIDSLNERQATVYNLLQITDEQNKKRVTDINRLVTQIDRAIDGQDLGRASELVAQLEKIDPNSPLAFMKRTKIDHMKNNTWEGFEQQKENLRKEIARLQSEAATKEQANKLEEARQVLVSIYSKDPLNPDMQKVKREIDRLTSQIDQQREQERALNERQATRKLYMGLGGIGGAVVLVFLALYFLIRRRHAQVLLEMEQRAILPLQELRDKALALGGPAGIRGGLDFGAGPANLIGQTETSDAEFVIPETETRKETETGLEDFALPSEDTQAPATPQPKTEEVRVERKPASAAVAPAATAGGEDDFLMDFGNEEEERKEKRVSALPKSPSEAKPIPGESTAEEIVFAFDDLQPAPAASPGPKTEPPITATEIPTAAPGQPEEEIVFSFDDVGADSAIAGKAPAKQAAAPERKLEPTAAPSKSATQEDSLYESISLDDLSLDLAPDGSLGAAEPAKSGASSGTGTSNPLVDDMDLNLDLKIDMPADTAVGVTATSQPLQTTTPLVDADIPDLMTEETAPLPTTGTIRTSDTAGATATATKDGVLFRQDFNAQPVGSMPKTWAGQKSDYAGLSVIDDPDGGGKKCIEFKKTRGEGPTSFSSKFPDVSGRIAVEFDIRCNEKNKHLLGFYIEKDGDFRRSVHTVVQCIDADRPAYLRVFTKPTPYTLGSWRHVKYIIDLPNSMVDGYVDNRLVAEGVRMGTKTDSMNTFSIRDNTESTGVLLLNNLVIYKAPQGA